ncbi:MAG TPA: hypothetical protein VKT32_14360 [Chthonomonadaceae bacterium]|nr:hypothetical protein [Chthonomonadaceae bacterium]
MSICEIVPQEASATLVSSHLEETSTQERKPNPGWFQPGYDPRRHEFTLEECREGGIKGYQAAWQSLERRFPGCDPHFLLCAILGSKPWYMLLDKLGEEPVCS